VTTLEPLGDRVVIEPPLAVTEKSGIFLPETAQRVPREGKVLAVGEGKRLDNGTLVPPRVKVGDIVAFPDYSFASLAVEDTTYWIVEGKDILVIVHPADDLVVA
jgi:chaperonin GroES